MYAYLNYVDEISLFLITGFKCIVEYLYCSAILFLTRLCNALRKEGYEGWFGRKRERLYDTTSARVTVGMDMQVTACASSNARSHCFRRARTRALLARWYCK